MSTATELSQRHCKACEGGVQPLTALSVRELLPALPHWKLSADGKSLRREWRMKDFAAALALFNAIAEVAEAEDHHPDLHLTGYRNAAVELSTHAIGGLSENDFILAARIDRLPAELKQ
jgi:4a-hydroxytetrahydrobiopterin dehydratase